MMDDNFFEVEPNHMLGSVLLCVIGLQLLILALHKTIGTRACLPWFLKKKFYNYERMMKDIDEFTAKSLVILLSNYRVIVLFVSFQ